MYLRIILIMYVYVYIPLSYNIRRDSIIQHTYNIINNMYLSLYVDPHRQVGTLYVSYLLAKYIHMVSPSSDTYIVFSREPWVIVGIKKMKILILNQRDHAPSISHHSLGRESMLQVVGQIGTYVKFIIIMLIIFM